MTRRTVPPFTHRGTLSTRSTWMRRTPSARPIDGPPVGPLAVDVCVIGAGMAGLSVAYELGLQGADVIVVEQNGIGGGETSHTTAHLSNALDDRFYRLERLHGADGARIAGQSHAAAIDLIEKTAHTLGIGCDFKRVDGYLFAAADGDRDELGKELEAASRADVDVELAAAAPLPFATGPALRFPHQAQFHPLAYLDGLATAMIARGTPVHVGAHVTGVTRLKDGMLEVELAGGGRIGARTVVDATNGTITSMTKLPLRQASYRTYVVSIDRGAAELPEALFWDTDDPYHYLRVVRDADGHDVVLIGGEDHRVGHEEEPSRRWNVLEHWIRERCPGLGETVDRWSGQIMEPADGMAFVGKSPDVEGVYIVTGDSGNGLTHAVIASVILPDLIAGRDHPWAALYEPGRGMIRATGTRLRDVMSSTVGYTDWVGGGDVQDVESIRPGHGAVIRRGIHMLAVYRDDEFELHECSARCPHMSAVVQWNEAEKSWDCPAHGSRFDALGKVLHGPAIGDLAPPPDRPAPEAETVQAPPAVPRDEIKDAPSMPIATASPVRPREA
jgi:glycine/D-amino acid oxidase-like deaminating enzyme/nitrite reductase/ring-hydroxylating ferredoxin subunit